MDDNRYCVKSEQLRWVCDPEALGFETTAELEPLASPIGQERAMAAMDFGANIASEGYNVFVLGPVGTGRSTMTSQALERIAKARPQPNDWCYVYNFEDPHAPRVIGLPAGKGSELREDTDELIEDINQAITRAFDSEDYQNQRDELLKDFREQRAERLQQFEQEADEAGFTVGRGPGGLVVAPAIDGEMMSPQDYAKLPEEERKVVDRSREELQDKLVDILRHSQRQEKEVREQVKKLDREVVEFAAGHYFDDLLAKYQQHPEVVRQLEQMKQDVIENVAQFRDGEEQTPQLPMPPGFPSLERSPYDRYRFNLLLGHNDMEGAPVVFESNPTIDNLTGQIEHQTHMGALVTDFTMIKPGALHRANGGYLLLEAKAVLSRPFAWEALKRCLKNKQIRVESLQDQIRWLSTVSLEPEPIPLDVKVVLLGSPQLYYLLYTYDEDFSKLFKVKADFNIVMDRGEEALQQYARFVATCCQMEDLPPFSAAAVAKIAESGVLTAGDQGKFTPRFVAVADLVREAAHWANENGNSDAVTVEDVQQAIDQHIWRSDRIEQRILELIEQGTIMVDTEGEAVGQINGIALLPLGDYMIGKPTRLTARSFLGRTGIVSIEREAELSGPIHHKGMLILSGYLGQKYSSRFPLSCAASISFEQSYEEVEGDSAACAELYTLLSSLGEIPIKQGLAVTGSVNQHGQVQPVGGVTRKIEGFFETCKVKGLTGEQGVIIPAANVRHLMLREEVVQAVQDNKFHIYAVETIDEGLEILTGMAAGEPDEEGNYPEGTAHGAVQGRLRQFAETLKEYGAGPALPGKGKDGEK